MILTIQTPNKKSLLAGLWQAEMMMGLETEQHSDNCFEIVCHDPRKVEKILEVSSGRVIYQK